MSAHLWIYRKDLVVVATDSRFTNFDSNGERMAPLDGVSKMRLFGDYVVTITLGASIGNGSRFMEWFDQLEPGATMQEHMRRTHAEGKRAGFNGFWVFFARPGEFGRARYNADEGTDDVGVTPMQPTVIEMGTQGLMKRLMAYGGEQDDTGAFVPWDWQPLPAEEMTEAQLMDFAVFLVQTSAKYRQFCGDPPDVGGPIDLALLRPGQDVIRHVIGAGRGLDRGSYQLLKALS